MNKQKLIEDIIYTSYFNNEGHIASGLSILDILIVLYKKILIPGQDQFILSKGHGSLGLYAVLLGQEFITQDEFYSFCQFNSKLGGHPSSKKLKDVLISTGSLGHGLPFAIGLALGKRISGEAGKVYCLIGDGEANEGTTWESALLASTLELNNLVCIMDFNGSGERAIKLNSCVDKFRSFGWDVCSVDGHNQETIEERLKCCIAWSDNSSCPIFIEAKTIKGKGCKVMENNPEWHHKSPRTELELQALLNEIY